MIITNLVKSSRLGFLFAALAAMAVSFSPLQAMKRKLEIVHQGPSLFDEFVLQDIQIYIVTRSLDLETPEKFLASLKKLRQLCFASNWTIDDKEKTNLRTFVFALQNLDFGSSANITPFQRDTFFTACNHNDIDSVMIIILATGSKFVVMKDTVNPLTLTSVQIPDERHNESDMDLDVDLDVSNLTRLQIAIEKNQEMLVWVLLTTVKAVPSKAHELMLIQNDDKHNAFHQVAQTGNLNIFKALVQASGEYSSTLICSQDAAYCNNMLHIAIASPQKDDTFIRKLFSSSQDIVLKLICTANKHGNTPLHLAARDGKIGVVKLIIETIKKTAENSNQALKDFLDFQNNDKKTACDLADIYRKKAIVKLLKSELEALPKQIEDVEKPTIQNLGETENDDTK